MRILFKYVIAVFLFAGSVQYAQGQTYKAPSFKPSATWLRYSNLQMNLTAIPLSVFQFQNRMLRLYDPEHMSRLIIRTPPYKQGFFCDFEDFINRKNPIRIDFSLR
ncbi:MAG: hypothetical protein R2794_03465 [Chitinophagales bacterium]